MNNDFGLHLKRMMLGTAAGHLLLATRSKFNLLSTAIRHPERVGTVANDQIAGALLPMLCRPGMTFIDVGAHIGSVVADVIRHDKSINIIAFEAIPEKAAALCRKFPGGNYS